MIEFENGPKVIIDNGSDTCKIGLSGDSAPLSFPCVYGKLKHVALVSRNQNMKEYYLGDEAVAKRDIIHLKYPIHDGIINDFDIMTSIWNHCFYDQLRVIPSQTPCLLTEAPFNPLCNRQKTTDIMFETFNVPAFYLSTGAALSLYTTGRTTGLVLDSGHTVTNTVPIYEGQKVSPAIQRSFLGGQDLSVYLRKLLKQTQTAIFCETLRDIKEKFCYVALDFEAQVKNYIDSNENDKVYQLPDGESITIRDQMFRCPEALFKPTLLDRETLGYHESVEKSISKCDVDIRKDLYSNIVLIGGTTLFPGISERLSKEVIALSQAQMDVKIVAPQERKFLAWFGGSILSSLSSFQQSWITKEEYQEYGPVITRKKCI